MTNRKNIISSIRGGLARANQSGRTGKSECSIDIETVYDKIGVLVAVSDLKFQQEIVSHLSKDYVAYRSLNGNDALRKMQNHSIDIQLVLCEFEFPDIDGLSLLRMIGSAYPDTDIIIICSSRNIDQVIHVTRSGAFDTVVKSDGAVQEILTCILRWRRYQSLDEKLARYAQLHDQLSRNMEERTFLSLDVVRSTNLKVGEDPLMTQYTFHVYQRLMERTILDHGGKTHSSAGDGMMTCYASPDSALSAAKCIRTRLEKFNLTQNHLHKSICIRIGIHTGSIVTDENRQISTMFSNTLDVVGHIQKDAQPGRIELSEASLSLLHTKRQFFPTTRVVYGLRVYYMA